MLKATILPEDVIEGRGAWKITLEGIDEIQYLNVAPKSTIKVHKHDEQWEIWVRLQKKEAYVCLKGEEHGLVNTSESTIVLMAIKGHHDYSWEDLRDVLNNWGFTVYRGSLIVKNR